MDTISRPLSRTEASDYLYQKHGIRRAPRTLAKLATLGRGPTFYKAGRAPLYDPAALDDWAAEISSEPVRSTSELKRSEA